jgi:ribose transport system ATP-binding protein
MTDRVLHTVKLSKSYGEVKAVTDIDFSIRKGEIRAIIGANGAGKSTFVKLIYGEIIADSGSIYIKDKIVKFRNPSDALKNGISMVPQDFGLIESMSIAENLSLINAGSSSIFYKKENANIQSEIILKKLSLAISPSKTVGELSVSEKQLISIAKALNTNSEIIIFDEPTSVLNINSFAVIKQIIADLKCAGKSIIYITHKLNEIFEIADSVSVFSDSKIVLTAEIKSIKKDDLLKFYSFSTNKKSVKADVSIRESLLVVENLFTQNLNSISFEVSKGESIGVMSNNYLEAVELATSVFGINNKKTGEVRLNGKVISSPYSAIKNKVGFIPEDRRKDGIFNQLNILDNVSILNFKPSSTFGVLNSNNLLLAANSKIQSLNIKCQSPFQSISELSGGNQQKVLFARWIAYDFELLILLEPTAGIDLGGKSDIHSIIEELKKCGKSFLIVSADLDELKIMSEKILSLENGKLQNITSSNKHFN